jgi:hypothetical protein
MIKFFKRIACGWKGHVLTFCRNIYGDEINSTGGKRSLWKCSKCGAYKLRPELHTESAPPETAR